ncbi:MAG: NAD-binding protein [Haloarculaceae archaeon]
MQGWKRRAVGYLVFVGAALVLTAVGYQWGMRVYEGRPRTFLDSLQFAVEMFTTTGFGGDAPWQSPEMHAFITVTDLLGMAVLVGALPVFVGPLVESTLSPGAPRELETALSDHVVICSDTSRAEELMEELDANAVPYVIIEPDRERADELYTEGGRVIRADPQSTDGLTAAGLPSARALFADMSDQVDASIVLAAKEVAETVPVVSVVESPDMETYHRLAGADHVLSPRSLIGEGLAAKVTTATRTEIDEAVTVGEQFRLAEISIQHGSSLAGTTLADSGIREQSGVNVIGVWIHGEFHPAPSPDIRLGEGSVLLVSGRTDQLERVAEMTRSSIRQFQARKTVVIGYGQVGRAVSAELDDAGVPYTVVDQVDMDGVDVVGDATDSETLTRAGVEDAETVVLALPDDTTTEFATLVVRDLAPEAQIIARIEEKANISKTYRAGGDYVLSLATITGRMSASRLLTDHDVLSIEQQIRMTRELVPSLAGETIEGANIRDRTGCTVIAIVRTDEVITDVGPDTAVESDDELVIVGTDEGIRTFERVFGSESDAE